MLPDPPNASNITFLTPSISVIIPHFNDLQGLQTCLTALREQSVPATEIIICDNGSPCGLEAIEHLCVAPETVVLEPVKGAAAARNAGVRRASGHILAFLDSDCIPDPGWLAAGCQALQHADLVGGAMILSFENPERRTNVEAFEAQFAFPNQRYVEREHFSVTANLFTKRSTFAQVGFFRPDVPEDKDWGQRAHAMGYRWIFAPDAKVLHPARRSWPQLQAKWKRLTREAYGYSPHKAKFLARSWLVLLSSPAFIAPLIRSKRLGGRRERLDVAALVLRLRVWRLLEAHRIVLSNTSLRRQGTCRPHRSPD